MKRRNKKGSGIIAYLLAFMMVFTMMPGMVFATGGQTDGIKAYVTIAEKGEFVTAKDGTTKVVNQEITVTDGDSDGKYTINDVFISAHDEFYNGGAAEGYDSDSANGYVSKLWGDTSGAFGFCQNDESSLSANDEITSGASIYAWIYKDTGYSDKYSYFDKSNCETTGGTGAELTLKSFSVLADEEAAAYKNATIIVDGEKTSYKTDENGKATIYFSKAGTYFVSAAGADGDVLVPPFCTVKVEGDDIGAQATVDSDKEALTLNTKNLTADLTLPTRGQSGKTFITWETSDKDVITADGRITRGTEVKSATLTATIKYGEVLTTKEFQVSVAEMSKGELAGILDDAAALLADDSAIELVEFTGGNGYGFYAYDSVAKDTNILTKISEIINEEFTGVQVAAQDDFSGNAGFEADGNIKYGETEQTANLPVKLSLGEQTKETTLTIKIPKHAKTKAEAVEELKSQITLDNILNGQEQYAVKDKLDLPAGETMGLVANWSSDSDALVIEGGTTSSGGVTTVNHKVVRPAYMAQDAEVALTVEFAYAYADYGMCDAGPMPEGTAQTFDIKVAAITEGEYNEAKTAVDNSLNSFDVDSIVYFADKNKKADLDGVTENLFLPDAGDRDQEIKASWKSDNQELIANPSSDYGRAVVKRPEVGESDWTCNLTLTLSKFGYTASREIPVNVKALTTGEIAEEQAKIQEIADALTFDVIKKDNTSADYVTSDLNLYRSAVKENGEIVWSTSANEITGYLIDWTYTDNVKQYGKIVRDENDVTVNLKATVKSADKTYTQPVEVTIPMTILGQGETIQSKYIKQITPVMENISASYKTSSDDWKVMDMGAYAKYNPDTANKITDEAKQAFINSAIQTILTSTKDTDLDKALLALTAVGGDVTELYPVNSENPVNGIDKLNDVEQSTSLWRAPYTLMVYNQGEYDSEEKENVLVDAILAAQKDDGSWKEWGVTIDTTANAIAALAFYDDRPDVQDAINKGVEYLSTQQKDSGAFDGGYGDNSNSTAMVIIGLAAAGIDPATDSRFIKNDNSVLDGLLKYKLADNSGFGYTDNSAIDDSSTEQSFRALIAAAQVMKTGKAYNVYDFSDNEVKPVTATEVVKPETPGTSGEDNKGNIADSNTNTGDDSLAAIFFVIALLAAVCAAAVCMHRRAS